MDTEFTNAPARGLSPEEISLSGERFYFNDLQEILEPHHRGEYVVIDVLHKKYIVDPDKLTAIQKAKEQFGDQIFYIVQVGTLQKSSSNFKKRNYAWQF